MCKKIYVFLCVRTFFEKNNADIQNKELPSTATLFVIYLNIIKDLKVVKALNDFRVITLPQQLVQQPNVRLAHGMESKMRSSYQP